jgi:hypothetical protein
MMETRKKNDGNVMVFIVATLALGLRPRQRLARVWDKREARVAHFIFPGV